MTDENDDRRTLKRRDVPRRVGAAGVATAGVPSIAEADELTDSELDAVLADARVQSIAVELPDWTVEEMVKVEFEGDHDGTHYVVRKRSAFAHAVSGRPAEPNSVRPRKPVRPYGVPGRRGKPEVRGRGLLRRYHPE